MSETNRYFVDNFSRVNTVPQAQLRDRNGQLVTELEQADLLEKQEDYLQSMSLCYRSKQPVEPLPKEQWFIAVDKPPRNQPTGVERSR